MTDIVDLDALTAGGTCWIARRPGRDAHPFGSEAAATAHVTAWLTESVAALRARADTAEHPTITLAWEHMAATMLLAADHLADVGAGPDGWEFPGVPWTISPPKEAP